MAAAATSSSSSSSSNSQGQEFIVRIPKQTKKRYHVMRFNAAHKQDISKWTQIRIERENNLKEMKMEDDMPKFGAGSEFGRDQKEEARRKKYGIIMKKYNPDDQPWLLRVGGKGGKKFKAIRDGGVSENTSFYVFCKAPDGVFEAFPIDEWYNFNPVNRFKALTAEEAEVEFERRDKVMNHFSIMVRKKMANEDTEGIKEEGEEDKGKKGKKDRSKEFKISEMDDWLSDSDGDGDEDDDDKDDDESAAKKKKSKASAKDEKKKKKKKPNQSEDEAMEESDEGDFDDREVDYMSASSSEGEEPEDEKANREMKGVEDEDALRTADQSDEEEEEEKEEEKPEGEEEPAKEEKGAEPKPKPKAEKKDAPSKSAPKGNSSGESTSESSDSDFDDSKFQSAMFMQKPKKKNGSEGSSRANTPTKHVSDERKSKGSSSSKALKRKMKEESPAPSKMEGPSPKRSRAEAGATSTPPLPSSWSGSTEGITEDSVRRYLLRKPMTTTELLQKFKSKKTGMSSDKLVNTIAQILKRLNPEKQTIKGKLYLSIKP